MFPQNLTNFVSLMLDESVLSIEDTLISYCCTDAEVGNSYLSLLSESKENSSDTHNYSSRHLGDYPVTAPWDRIMNRNLIHPTGTRLRNGYLKKKKQKSTQSNERL